MNRQIVSQIEDEFFGYDDNAIFRLTNGQIWQQSRYKYAYHYAYRPHVRISLNPSGVYILEVDGMSQSVEVVQISLVAQGKIVSDFRGYNHQAIFKFQNGQTWQQIENRHRYHYSYGPQAYIINGLNGIQMSVEGMNELVRVRKI
jgi:hypothetical protein